MQAGTFTCCRVKQTARARTQPFCNLFKSPIPIQCGDPFLSLWSLAFSLLVTVGPTEASPQMLLAADHPCDDGNTVPWVMGPMVCLMGIYQDTWVGVEPSLWDDTINTQNDAPAPWYSAQEPVNSTSKLTERDLVAGICRAGNACLSATQNTVYNIGTAATQFFQNLAQQQGVQSVLNVLSNPIVQKILIGTSPIRLSSF
jgi:hypothetical protein